MIYEYDITGKEVKLEVILYKLEEIGLQDKLKFTPTWNETTLYLTFDGAINEPTLDAMMDTYTGNEDIMPRICEIYGHPSETNFIDLDYTIKNLFPNRIFDRGELQKVEWYLESTFETLVLSTSYTYVRDPFGFAVSRDSLRVWKNRDGSDNFKTKVSQKFYTPLQMIKEGKRRRGNIVDNVQLPTFAFLQEAANDPDVAALYGLNPATVLLVGREFMDRFELEFTKFVDNSSSITDLADPNFNRKTIVVAFEEAATTTDIWLNFQPSMLGGARILDYLVNEFSI